MEIKKHFEKFKVNLQKYKDCVAQNFVADSSTINFVNF